MFNITDSATLKINDLLAEENNPNMKVRVFVQGGGCSGFQYGFTFDEETNDDDFVIENIIVDSLSMQYMTEAVIDYIDDIHGSQFKISNPQAASTCGCGSSFSV
jgi:iron-sulfur cluster insertion protein